MATSHLTIGILTLQDKHFCLEGSEWQNFNMLPDDMSFKVKEHSEIVFSIAPYLLTFNRKNDNLTKATFHASLPNSSKRRGQVSKLHL